MIDNPLLFVAGIAVLFFLSFDLFQTIAQASEGPASRMIQRAVQRLLTSLFRITGKRVFLVWSTSLLILGLVSVWITLLYVGWLLVFSGDGQAVLHSTSQSPAGLGGVVYFTGFTISTLGVGDYVPNGPFWQFLTVFAALTAFFLLTFTISFLLSVTEKQALRRKLALSIHHLGETPQQLLVRHWQPEKNQLSENVLDLIVADLIQFEQQHKEQAILNRFHGPSPRNSVQLAIATLDEALTMAECAADVGLPTHFLYARESLTDYLENFEAAVHARTDEVPPIPDVSPLREANIPLRSPGEREAAYAGLAQRRRQLHALVRDSGWSWEQVEQPNPR